MVFKMLDELYNFAGWALAITGAKLISVVIDLIISQYKKKHSVFNVRDYPVRYCPVHGC